MISFAGRAVLLDIEGTTSSISFVHDVMFPFVRTNLHDYLAASLGQPECTAACEQVARDAGAESLAQRLADQGMSTAQVQEAIEPRSQSSDGRRCESYRAQPLQGLIWESGFASGELKAHVYPDVLPSIRRWRAAGLDVRIYSSGSIAAQKLFFGHVADEGNCLSLFTGHYDTTIGGKRETDSYARIAADWKIPASDILFVSDLAPELTAADTAGFQTATSVRPGNAPLPSDWALPTIQSFEEIVLSAR
ncbi:MAG: acireductone synthase [Pirellulales bacterium]